MVELTFKYSEKEYVKAARQYLIINRTIRKIDIFVIPLFIIFSIFYAINSGFNLYSIVALIVATFALLMGSMLYFYVPIKTFRSTSKFHEEYYLLFNDNGIKFKTATINSELKWDTYSNILSNKDFYFLIQHPRIYTVIPKRAFENNQVIENFERLVTNHLKITTID